MSNTAMGVEAVAAKSAKKHVWIERNASKVMSFEQAMGNFCKILGTHNDCDIDLGVAYTAKITPNFKVEFYYSRNNSEMLDYKRFMRIGLINKFGGQWTNTPIHVEVEDSLDLMALVEEFKEKTKSYYTKLASTNKWLYPTELMTAILAA